MHLAVGGGHRDCRIPLLDLPAGPEDRFDDLLGLEADTGGRQVGTDRPALIANPVTREADELRCGEDSGPALGISLPAGVLDQLCHGCRIKWVGWSRRRYGDARFPPG